MAFASTAGTELVAVARRGPAPGARIDMTMWQAPGERRRRDIRRYAHALAGENSGARRPARAAASFGQAGRRQISA